MNTIGNKMFAYIDNHSELTTNMINQYHDSLIFLGDEQQIFAPAINTYIGIGKTSYQNLLNSIANTNSGITEYDKYIHNDSVTAIFTQFSPEELVTYLTPKPNHTGNVRGVSISYDSAYTAFKANKNVVLKGLNNYQPNGTVYYDELGRSFNVVNTSGITVNIEHASDIRTGKYVFNGEEYSYTYYDPYDTITIDDTKTWSYIMASNTYMIDFVTKFSSQQADRVYKNLIGNTDDPVYIEKKFDEAFNYDTITGILTQFRDVYVKLKNDSYARVTVENDADGKGYSILYNGYIIYTNDSTKQQADITNILADQGGYNTYASENAGDKYEPVWYHFDDNSTASDNINIVDGIQTLKEVAYILDQITDGNDDDPINLTYNIAYNYIEIQNLKKWQTEIGNETVSAFKSESSNELLTVNYYSYNLWDKDKDNEGFSTGRVKLDLDLKLAQTYVLEGSNVTYAAYLNDGQVPNNYTTYFIYTGDPTNINNYHLPSDNLKNLIAEKGDTTVEGYRINFDTDNNIITGRDFAGNVNVNDIDTLITQNQNQPQNQKIYIYFPYEKRNYDFTKGLTDVKWVTSYVREVYNDLNNRINTLDVSGQIASEINKLAYNDTDKSNEGMFVSEVDETKGIISVKRTKLPLDYIIHNDIISNEDLFLKITVLEAKAINDRSVIYIKNNNNYNPINDPTNDSIWSNIQNEDGYKNDNLYVKQNINSMVQVPTNTTYTNLIINHGQTSYFFKDETTGGKLIYKPIDVIQENTREKLTSYIGSGQIYYWNKSTGLNKYLEVSYVQNYNGSTTTKVNSYITYLSMASATSTGLADAWDVRRTIESMFEWVDIRTNKIIG